jgi:ribosome biogenesis GTPase
LLNGRITVLAGPSGVGKSSLLNVLDPDAERDVGEVSAATGKGRHVTTGARLYAIGPATYVADTAGVRSVLFQGIEPDELPGYFPEFRPHLGNCQFADCTHLGEEGCAVLAAVAAGEIAPRRYESYAIMRRGDADDER